MPIANPTPMRNALVGSFAECVFTVGQTQYKTGCDRTEP